MIKKPLSKLSIFAFILTGITSAHADNQANTVQGVEVTALIDFLKTSMYTVTTPFKVFHYFQGWGGFKGQFPSDNWRALAYVNYNAVQYLKNFGKPNTNGSYLGSALYAATDPMVSMDYGKNEDWQMAEIEIPPGFRFINVDSGGPIPQGARDVLVSLGCGDTWKIGHHTAALFQAYYFAEATSKCIDGIRQIIEGLHVDALAYKFVNNAYLAVCQNPNVSSEHDWAFVFLSDRWLKPDLVRLFNSQTTDNNAERLRIESLFYKAYADLSARYVDRTVNYPAVVSESNHPFNEPSISVHWQDLNGETTNADIDSWIKDNLFACGDHKNYEKSAQ